MRLRWDGIIARLSYRFNFLAIRSPVQELGSAWGDGFKKPRSLGEGTGAKALD